MALLAVLSNPYKEALSFMNVKAATPTEKDLLRIAMFPQIRSKISGALSRKAPISVHISGPKGEFVRFRMTDPKKYVSFATMVLSPKWVRGLTPTEARQRLGALGFNRLTLGVIGRVGPGKSELQSVLVPKARVAAVAQTYLAKPGVRRVAMNPAYPGMLLNTRTGPVTAAERKWADAMLRRYSGFKSFDELVAARRHGYTPTMRFPGSAILRSLYLRATGTRAHGTQDYGVFPRRGMKVPPRSMFNPYEVVHRKTGERIFHEPTYGRARSRARTLAGTYPASSIEIRETASSRNNPRLGEKERLDVPFRPGKKYTIEQIDQWVKKVAIPAITKRWEQAQAQYKRFHKGSLPNSVSFNIQHLGVSKNVTDVEFGVSEGKEWMAPYQVPKTSGKYEGDGSQGRYVHAHGDSEIEVNIKRPVSTKKLPERFHTPDGKFVGVIPSRNVKITDWYRG